MQLMTQLMGIQTMREKTITVPTMLLFINATVDAKIEAIYSQDIRQIKKKTCVKSQQDCFISFEALVAALMP